MNLMIREAEIGDLDGILQVENACSGMPWTMAQLEEELNYRFAHTFVAEKDERIAGFFTMHILGDEAHLNEFDVLPLEQNAGIGNALLRRLLEICNESGVRKITLEVRQSALPARHLYEKNGWKQVGVRKNFYRSPTEDGLVLLLET